MQGVFITGTGTDVGKTFIGSALARALVQRNISVIPKKPVESGCLKRENELIPQDAVALKEAAAYQGPLSEVCPYRFELPISPVRAAHLANNSLTTEQLVSTCLQGSENGFIIVEGAGGFYTPLTENGLNADLALALQLPVLLISDDRLGVISQVLLSAEAIQTRGLHLCAVVLNKLDNHLHEHMNNAADLREYLNCPVFVTPYSRNDKAVLPEALIDAVLSHSPSDGKQFRAVP